MRSSLVCCTRRMWRLPVTGVGLPHRVSPIALLTPLSAHSSIAPAQPAHVDGGRRWLNRERVTRRPRRRRFPMPWLLWPQWASRRAAALRSAAAARVPVPAAVVHACRAARGEAEQLLALVERPARVGAYGALTALHMGAELAVSILQLFREVYLYVFGPRLRRFLRFAIGIPFFAGTWFLLEMRDWYFPEVGKGLDTSCVAALPLCYSTEEAMTTAVLLQYQYRRLMEDRGVAADGAPAAAARAKSLARPLEPEEENDLLGAIFVLLRSLETQIIGTAEERELITPRADVAVAAPPRPAAAVAPAALESAAVDQDDVVTATPNLVETHDGVASVPASAAASPVMSPAEFILRVIMTISIAEGWSDITEHTRVLFQELVRSKTPPVQSHIVQAVGELCSLSYELESGQVDAITLDQRKRIAAAIDAFRPEKSVEERCTIAHEITILPLPDFDHTTRCLGMIRRSPGRKPQLILCFVGSNSKRNWLTNFNYWPVPLPERYGVVGAPIPGLPGRVAQPQVHRGFLGLVQTVPYKEVAADFDHVLLVGHSLGGALAQLAGLELAAERPSRRITVITMASPRVLAVDWRSRLRRARLLARTQRLHQADTACTEPETPALPCETYQRDTLATMLKTPPNYRHFRGYLQPDVVPHLPPEWLHFTHSGQRIPLNTGCSSSLSFMAWGMYSELYHSSDLYKLVLKQPMVSQTHWYTPEKAPEEEVVDAEEYVGLHV